MKGVHEGGIWDLDEISIVGVGGCVVKALDQKAAFAFLKGTLTMVVGRKVRDPGIYHQRTF